MMCVNPINQPIYQALLDKAASYPPEKHYQAQAYTNVAKCVRAWTYNLYTDYVPAVGCVGPRIASFIYDFRKKNPQPIQPTILPLSNQTDINTPDTPDDVFASDGYQGAIEAMDTAHNIAAQNAPKHTAWSNDDAQRDDAERAAFQARLDASRIQEVVLGTITDGGVRRSSRLQSKPKVQYCDDDDDAVDDDSDETYIDDQRVDEEDLDEREKIIQTIKGLCAKKGWEYSDDLITEYDAWRATATEDYKIKKYIHLQGYRNLSEPAIAKQWATQFSDSLRKQKQRSKIAHGLRKYCDKNKIQYEDTMYNKYIAWYYTPSIQEWVKNSYIAPSYITPISGWFATLKKVIVW
jgi:hypothetical protein